MATDYRRPVDAVALAHNFTVFAAADCASEPLYAALSDGVAKDPTIVGMLMAAPYPQRRPVLLFASVHDLLLAGSSHELARFYRSIVEREVREDFERATACFVDFCRVHREPLAQLLAERSVQTNEVGRSAGLRLALSTLDADRPIALIDVGCSAGLNLLVDRYRFAFTYADGSSVNVGDGDVLVPTDIVAGRPFCDRALPRIVRRLGIDRSPLDIRDPRDARWLRACIWPSDRDRHRRLAAAIAEAKGQGQGRLDRLDLLSADAVDGLPDVLAGLDAAIRPVLFHSWAVSYLDRETRRRFTELAGAMVAERDGAWISAEGPAVVPGLPPAPLPDDADATRREATSWHMTTRERGVVTSRVVARSHPHCRWIEWLDGG